MEGLTSAWRKSHYSTGNGGNCVETASSPSRVLVRDTKQAHMGDARTILAFGAEAWAEFTSGLR